MIDNLGVDVKPIASAASLKNMWEQKLNKNKQQTVLVPKMQAPVQVTQPKQPETNTIITPPKQIVPQVTQLKKPVEPVIIQKQVPPPSIPTESSAPVSVPEPIKQAPKQQNVSTAGMSLKERMKVWQQVTSPKTAYTPPPVVAPKVVPPEPKLAQKIQPVTPPPVQPKIEHKIQPKITLNTTPVSTQTTPKVQKVQVARVPEVPVNEVKPSPALSTKYQQQQQQGSLSINPKTAGGIQTSFIPASKKISLWQNMINKNKADVQKSKQENQKIAKINARLSYQPPKTTQVSTKGSQRSTFAPQSNDNDINLDQILGITKQQQPIPSVAFHKKPTETTTKIEVPVVPQQSVKQTMRLMKQALEKGSNSKAVTATPKPQYELGREQKHQVQQAPVLKQQVKEQVKECVREQIKQQIKQQVKQQVIQQVIQQINQQVIEQLKQQIKEQIRQQLQHIKQQTQQEAKQQLNQQIQLEVPQENNQQTKQQIQQEVAEQLKQQINQEINQQVIQQAHKQVNQQISPQVNQQVNQNSTQQVDKYVDQPVQQQSIPLQVPISNTESQKHQIQNVEPYNPVKTQQTQVQKPVEQIKPQVPSAEQDDYSKMMTRLAKQKKRMTLPTFDDA